MSSFQVKVKEEKGAIRNSDLSRFPLVPYPDIPSAPERNTIDDQQEKRNLTRASRYSLRTVQLPPLSSTSGQHQHRIIGNCDKVNAQKLSTSRRIVKLVKGRVEEFGFTLEPEVGGTGFVIRSITPKGIAAKSKSLHVGMKVYAINDKKIDKLPLYHVNYLIRDCESQMTLLVEALPEVENELIMEKFGKGQNDLATIIAIGNVGSLQPAKITMHRNKVGESVQGILGVSSGNGMTAAVGVSYNKSVKVSSGNIVRNDSTLRFSAPLAHSPPGRYFVLLRRGYNEELGFDVKKTQDIRVNGYVISSIIRRGVAARSRDLRVGLQVHSINRVEIDNLSEFQVDHLITSCGNQVLLEVSYPVFT